MDNQDISQEAKNQAPNSAFPSPHANVNFLILGGIILILFVVFGFGAYNLGKQASIEPTKTTPTESVTQPAQTQDAITSPTLVPVSSSPTAVAKQVRKISYGLPTGWQTKTDKEGRFEVGFDADRYDASNDAANDDNRIDLSGKWVSENGQMKRLGWNKQFYITSYVGGSRHDEVYKILGENPSSTGSTTKDYSEREYSYNGWNCLFINGVSISQYPVAWGYCPISSTEALVLAFDSYDWIEIEKQTAAIRLVK